MAHVRDTRVELPPDYGQLADLGWLVGTWVAENEDAHVEVKGRWVENNHYLARTHSVTESGKVTSTGLEMIGVDALTGQITSWSFTSDGGRAIGDNKQNVFETGIYNLTKDEAPMLVHLGKDKTQQWTLVRLNKDDSAASDDDSKNPKSNEGAEN